VKHRAEAGARVVKRGLTRGRIAERWSDAVLPQGFGVSLKKRLLDWLGGGGRRGESCGLEGRAIGVGCSIRECRLQKSVSGILPATPR
jgi:hypothetical protein